MDNLAKDFSQEQQDLTVNLELESQEDIVDLPVVVTRFLNIITRLEEVLDYETKALETQEMPDFNQINIKKVRLLRELEHAKANLDNHEEAKIHYDIVAKNLANIQPKLERNHYLLGINLQAVGNLVEMLKSRIIDMEADGTYTKADFTASRQDTKDQN